MQEAVRDGNAVSLEMMRVAGALVRRGGAHPAARRLVGGGG